MYVQARQGMRSVSDLHVPKVLSLRKADEKVHKEMSHIDKKKGDEMVFAK